MFVSEHLTYLIQIIKFDKFTAMAKSILYFWTMQQWLY